jgi:Lon-like ATP-dependent protease
MLCCCACRSAGSIDLNDLSRLVDAAASLTSADDVTLQGILETLHVPTR